MNFLNRIVNTLVYVWRLTEFIAKVKKAEQDGAAAPGNQ